MPTIAVTEKNPAYALKKKSSDQEDNSDYECVTEDCLDGQETTSNIAYQLMNSKEGLTHESTFAESSDGHYLTLKKSTLNQQQVVGTARVN